MTTPCCPNNQCQHHAQSLSKIVRHGYFGVRCGRRVVERFRTGLIARISVCVVLRLRLIESL